MQKSNDDMPEMTESRSSARAQRSQARASLIRAAQGKTLWDVLDSYSLDCLVELRLGVDSPDPKERLLCAREILSVMVRMPPRPALPPQAGVTPEEREQRMVEAEQDAGVRAWLQARGWTPPKERKEQN